MSESPSKVREDLKAYFSDAFQDSPRFETYVRIGSYLSSQMQCYSGLSELEKRLHKESWDRVKAIQENILITTGEKFTFFALWDLLKGIQERRFLENHDAEPYKFYAKMLYRKLLSSVLYAWERDNGFTHDTGGKVDILVGNVGKSFNEQLKAGRAFKDIGAGAEHGEFTHRIQWFIVGEGLMIPNAGELYRHVAKWISREKLERGSSGAYKRYLWEFLFDRDGIPSNAASVYFQCVDKSDFRAPSNLNRYLTESPTAPFEILRQCLKDRRDKRTIHTVDPVEYILKKAPKSPYDKQLKTLHKVGVVEETSALANSIGKGLFIRRNGEITSIAWELVPK
jgi:hypothetical protein